MEVLLTIFTVIFVALLIGFTLTFGLTLLALIVATAVVAALLTFFYDAWRRWRFVHRFDVPKETPPSVIDVEYKDITNKDS